MTILARQKFGVILSKRKKIKLAKIEKSEENNKNRMGFLLSFFDGEGYEEKKVNGFWLIKHWNGNIKAWRVSIYTEESHEKYKKSGNWTEPKESGVIETGDK